MTWKYRSYLCKTIAQDLKNSFHNIGLVYYSEELLTRLKESVHSIIHRGNSTHPNSTYSSFSGEFNLNHLTKARKKEWNDALKKYPGNESFYI